MILFAMRFSGRGEDVYWDAVSCQAVEIAMAGGTEFGEPSRPLPSFLPVQARPQPRIDALRRKSTQSIIYVQRRKSEGKKEKFATRVAPLQSHGGRKRSQPLNQGELQGMTPDDVAAKRTKHQAGKHSNAR